jgi:hypothetical protein
MGMPAYQGCLGVIEPSFNGAFETFVALALEEDGFIARDHEREQVEAPTGR